MIFKSQAICFCAHFPPPILLSCLKLACALVLARKGCVGGLVGREVLEGAGLRQMAAAVQRTSFHFSPALQMNGAQRLVVLSVLKQGRVMTTEITTVQWSYYNLSNLCSSSTLQ